MIALSFSQTPENISSKNENISSFVWNMEGYRDIPTRPLTSPLFNGHQSSWRFVATKQNNLLLQLMSSDPQIVQLRYDDIFSLFDTFGQKEKESFVVG